MGYMNSLKSALLKGAFIAFLGPVGVGKSTIINTLTRILNKKGIKVQRLYIKAFHGLSYILWYIILCLLGLPKSNAPWYSIPMHRYIGLARILTVVSAYIDSLLSLPLKIILARLLKFFKYVVVSEEYLHTSFFEYLYSFIVLNIRHKFYTAFPLHIIYSLAHRYKPDLTIVLDTDLKTLFKRWKRRGYGDPQLKYVFMLHWFLRQQYLHANIILNTSNMNPSKTLAIILTFIAKECSRV